jgi:hypothetical protein
LSTAREGGGKLVAKSGEMDPQVTIDEVLRALDDAIEEICVKKCAELDLDGETLDELADCRRELLADLRARLLAEGLTEFRRVAFTTSLRDAVD